MNKSQLFSTRNNLDVESREKIVSLLNQHLADTFDLYSQTKQGHWNVKGPHFIALHELFDKLAAQLADDVDTIAEQATALGGTAQGTSRQSAAALRLPEHPPDVRTGTHQVEALAARYAALAGTCGSAIDAASQLRDADTADLFTEISRGLDKSIWFLESHLLA
jgi:starvation-inducible DNA-binding protein